MVKKTEDIVLTETVCRCSDKHNTNVIIKVNKNEKAPFIRLTKPLIKKDVSS